MIKTFIVAILYSNTTYSTVLLSCTGVNRFVLLPSQRKRIISVETGVSKISNFHTERWLNGYFARIEMCTES